VVVIGNALSRGNPLVEYVLDEGMSYVSGPQWLYEQVLAGSARARGVGDPRQDDHFEHAGVDSRMRSS
jgi:hypothetical protein